MLNPYRLKKGEQGHGERNHSMRVLVANSADHGREKFSVRERQIRDGKSRLCACDQTSGKYEDPGGKRGKEGKPAACRIVSGFRHGKPYCRPAADASVSLSDWGSQSSLTRGELYSYGPR